MTGGKKVILSIIQMTCPKQKPAKSLAGIQVVKIQSQHLTSGALLAAIDSVASTQDLKLSVIDARNNHRNTLLRWKDVFGTSPTLLISATCSLPFLL